MTPLLMELTAGEIIEIDAIGMFLNILIVTIIPVGIGCFLNYTYSKSKHFPTIQSLMPGLSVICLACIVGGVISTVHDDFICPIECIQLVQAFLHLSMFSPCTPQHQAYCSDDPYDCYFG